MMFMCLYFALNDANTSNSTIRGVIYFSCQLFLSAHRLYNLNNSFRFSWFFIIFTTRYMDTNALKSGQVANLVYRTAP